MALSQFSAFVASAPDGAMRVDPMGETAQSRFDYVGEFLKKHQRKVAAGVATVAGAGAIAMSSMAAPGIALNIHDGTTANTIYQSVEAHIPGHAAAMQNVVDQSTRMAQEAKAAGLLKIMPMFHGTYLNADDSSHAIKNNDLSCNVQLAVGTDGSTGSLGPVLKAVQGEDLKYHREEIVAHESAHCDFPLEAAPFRHTNLDPQTEQYINEWVMHPDEGGNGLVYHTFDETQADVRGSMIMLRHNHFSEAAWNTVKHDYTDRLQQQQLEESQGLFIGNDPHATAPALAQLIADRDKVEKMDPSQYTDYAYGVTSNSVLQVFDGARLRASPLARVAQIDPRLESSDPAYLGKQGFNAFMTPMSIDGMRNTVVNEAMRMHEQQVGVRIAPNDAQTQPRQLAQQWDAKYHPFADLKVTPLRGDGVDYQWANDESRQQFLRSSPDLDRKGIPAARLAANRDAVQADLAKALHVDDASLAHVTAPTGPALVPHTDGLLLNNHEDTMQGHGLESSSLSLSGLSGFGQRIFGARLKAAEQGLDRATATVKQRLSL